MGAIAMMLSGASVGAGVSAGHKYWRVVSIDNGNGGNAATAIALSAMLFKDDAGSTISPSGGSGIESSHNGSQDTSKLFDGTDATYWSSNSESYPWVGIQFAATQKVRQIALQQTASMGGAAPPVRALVQFSDDGVTWGTCAVLDTGTFTNDTPKWFDFTSLFPSYPRSTFGAHAYWRMRDRTAGAASGGTWTGLSAMLFKDNTGSSIATAGGTALESAHFGSQDSAKLFDSNNSTFWESSSIGLRSWAGYQFSSAKTVMQVALQRTASMDSTDPPRACTFEYSDDGVTWAIAAAAVTGSFTNDTPKYFDLTTGL